MKISVKLDSVRDKNLKQMKQLNAAIFPVKYQVSRATERPFPPFLCLLPADFRFFPSVG